MRLPGSLAAPTSIRCGRLTTTAITSRISSPLCRVAALKSFENSFHQDLNGDGQIGVGGVATVIEFEWFDQPDRGWESLLS